MAIGELRASNSRILKPVWSLRGPMQKYCRKRSSQPQENCWCEPGMSDDACFHLQTFCGSLAPAAGFPREFFSRGSHWVADVRTCACVCLSWYRHTQLVFSGGLAPLAAQRVDGIGTEQQAVWAALGAGDGLALTTCL